MIIRPKVNYRLFVKRYFQLTNTTLGVYPPNLIGAMCLLKYMFFLLIHSGIVHDTPFRKKLILQ